MYRIALIYKCLITTQHTGNGASYGRDHHYNDSRYHMLNLHATFTKGTVEFRLFQFDAPANGKRNGLHAGQLKSYIQLCLALSNMAKMVKSASAKEQQMARDSEETARKESVLEALKKQKELAAEAEKPKKRPRLLLEPEEKVRV